MPKVKKKTARTRKKKAAKAAPGMVDSARQFLSRYIIAGAAGVTVVALIGAVILWSGGYFGMLAERASRLAGAGAVTAGFEVRRITAKGYEHTSEQDLLGAVGPVIGSSLMHFDLFSAQARVEQLGWVRSATVSRLWPNTIHVSVREREPAAVWQLSGALHLIDPNGAVIRPIDAFEYSNLPLIVGAGAPGAASGMLQALRAEPALWGKAAALIRVGDRRWNLRLKSGADVKLPALEYEAAIRELAKIHTAYGLLDQDLEYVDLRDPNKLVYLEKNADSEKTPATPPLR